jgi:hypothetical protein
MSATYDNKKIRLEVDQYEEIRRRAELERTTITEKVRTYIEWGLENDEKISKGAVNPN